MPAIAGQEGDRVDHDEALDELRSPLGEDQADGAPVVHDQADPPEPQMLQEALEEAIELGDRVREVAGLAGASEAGEVGRDAAAALKERHPVVGVGGHAVQVEGHRAAAG